MKSNLKVITPEPKPTNRIKRLPGFSKEHYQIDHKPMIELTGKTQDLSRLTPPHFEDATDRVIEHTPFKKRLLTLWNNRK